MQEAKENQTAMVGYTHESPMPSEYQSQGPTTRKIHILKHLRAIAMILLWETREKDAKSKAEEKLIQCHVQPSKSIVLKKM